MELRPNFTDIKTYEEFEKHYWYRDELSKLCKHLCIDSSGIKEELNHNIKEYFDGNIVKKKKRVIRKNHLGELSLQSHLLECEFSFNAKFRKYFSKLTEVEHFKFTADMATTWRKVKNDDDSTFTVQDMLDVYYKKTDYAKYNSSSCQWNQFLKDFCANEENASFDNKMKVASILWAVAKKSSGPKLYSNDLVAINWELIKAYSKQ